MADADLQNGHRPLAQNLPSPGAQQVSPLHRGQAITTRQTPTQRTTTLLDDQAGPIHWSIRCQSEKAMGPHPHLHEGRQLAQVSAGLQGLLVKTSSRRIPKSTISRGPLLKPGQTTLRLSPDISALLTGDRAARPNEKLRAT